MKSISEYTKEQYQFVQGSRNVLFDYCKTISPADFVNQKTSFGSASIRDLLVHIANTYDYWIAKVSLKKNVVFSEREANNNINDVIELFKPVDLCMCEFIDGLENSETEIEFLLNGVQSRAKPFKLFSHVITHEYHHKGQILSLSRQLGYTPVDTDIMR